LKILAIETSTEACSVALVHGEEILARSELAPRRHGELVLPMADSLLAEAGMSRQALEGIAVGRGPGAFTGVRLAISLAQGMAMALDLPVVTVSSLQALAMEEDAGLDDILADRCPHGRGLRGGVSPGRRWPAGIPVGRVGGAARFAHRAAGRSLERRRHGLGHLCGTAW